MTRQHTPGPWGVAKSYTDEAAIRTDGSDDGQCVAVACAGDEMEANARLIAAAPELLDALKAFADIAEDDDQYPLHTEQARAAIAKATGGAP